MDELWEKQVFWGLLLAAGKLATIKLLILHIPQDWNNFKNTGRADI